MNEAEEERIRPGDVKFWETWEVFESPHFRMFPFSNVRELEELSMYNYKSWDAFFFSCFSLRWCSLAWRWTWWTSQRLLDPPGGCDQSCLPSEWKNLWEMQQRLRKNCRKVFQIPDFMQFQTSFRSSNLNNLNEPFMKLHTSVVIWERFPVREPFHSDKENTHPSRDSLLHVYKTRKYLNEQEEAKKNKSEVDSQCLA